MPGRCDPSLSPLLSVRSVEYLRSGCETEGVVCYAVQHRSCTGVWGEKQISCVPWCDEGKRNSQPALEMTVVGAVGYRLYRLETQGAMEETWCLLTQEEDGGLRSLVTEAAAGARSGGYWSSGLRNPRRAIASSCLSFQPRIFGYD